LIEKIAGKVIALILLVVIYLGFLATMLAAGTWIVATVWRWVA
jgi:hypothetical protein